MCLSLRHAVGHLLAGRFRFLGLGGSAQTQRCCRYRGLTKRRLAAAFFKISWRSPAGPVITVVVAFAKNNLYRHCLYLSSGSVIAAAARCSDINIYISRYQYVLLDAFAC